MKRVYIFIVLAVLLTQSAVMAHDHTHIGRDADGVFGTADDNTLWFFAAPDQPQWGILDMVPTGDYIGSKQVYMAELDCWHSAHPASGVFQLGGTDSNQNPAWQIALERVRFSSADFWMALEATGEEVLKTDGSQLDLGQMWMADKYNENGTLGAWGFHVHTKFFFLADGAGETVTASFKAVDLGATGYSASEVYIMTFQTIPEPATLGSLGLGLLSVIRKRK